MLTRLTRLCQAKAVWGRTARAVPGVDGETKALFLPSKQHSRDRGPKRTQGALSLDLARRNVRRRGARRQKGVVGLTLPARRAGARRRLREIWTGRWRSI